MSFLQNIIGRFKRQIFETVVDRNLIYNTCWEDPAIDRQLLDITESSTIVTLTSAGCNALDYLLDNPAKIYCVDANPAQNSLLKLKQALFWVGNYNLLWQMFGEGRYAGASTLYHNKIRSRLPAYAQQFWDHHISYFNPYAHRSSLYYHGTAGAFAYIIHKRLSDKGLQGSVHRLLNAESLREQQYYFDEIEPHIWNVFSRWLMQRSATMALLGVPHEQRALINNEMNSGLADYIQQSVEEIFTNRPIADNYFWRVYLTGSYHPDCCPNYLKSNYFDFLREHVSRLDIHTCSLIRFLQKNSGRYSHFNLLDHQDWMSEHQKEKVADEWTLLLQNAQPGAKILFRSAGKSRSFIPDFVESRVHFKDKQTDYWHLRDRVGTYGSTHLAVVNEPLP